MDQDTTDPALEESIQEVLKTLPPVIQSYLKEGRYTPVAQSLMGKYRLRIDQCGVLERELMLLLMGIDTPVEFNQALLTEARIDQATVAALTKDVNELVFIPLRKEEEELSKPQPVKVIEDVKPFVPPTAPPTPSPIPPAPRVTSDDSSVKVNPSQFMVPPPTPVVPPAPRPADPRVVTLPPKTIMPLPTANPVDIRYPQKLIAKVPEKKRLEDHEEPHLDLHTSKVPPAMGDVPANLPGVLPAPATISVPVSTPIPAVPVAPAPIPAAVVASVPRPSMPLSIKPGMPPITSYSSDPYREPIDLSPTV